MSDSTSILDLPTDTMGTNNISLNVTENRTPNEGINVGGNMSASGNSFSLDQTTINQIVNGLQQASTSGATQLSSRDIPITTSSHTTDPYVQANYVPSIEEKKDYIKENEQQSDIINNYNRNFNKNQSLDDIYNEIQMPLLIVVIYFLFQLPFFKKFLFQYFPVLFSKDGNLNMNGFLFTSILFGLLVYLLNKTSTHFGTF
jgi:hypothetical protein